MNLIIPKKVAVFELPESIVTGLSGHEILWALFHKAKVNSHCDFYVEAKNLTFFEGNMSALFLSIAHKLKEENYVTLILLNSINLISELFDRNGLICGINNSALESYDYKETTVCAKLFNPELDDDKFIKYIQNDLLKHRGFTNINSAERSWIEDGFIETFSNVNEHSNTHLNLSACGQYFPKKDILKFTICDLGNGFLKKIQEFTKNSSHPVMTGVNAIEWAIAGNSTREKAHGGTGLCRLVQKCKENPKFGMVIVTDNTYWRLKNQKLEIKNLSTPTHGTTIHFTVKK